jgi:hypothetical protein
LPQLDMKISDITPLGGGMYELEQGSSDRKLGDTDLVEL